MRVLLAAAHLLALPAGAAAVETIRLSPTEREAALAAGESRAAPRRADDALDSGQPRPDRGVHGEIGAFIGTGGAHGAFGTMVAPLGDRGTAAFSFSTEDFGRRRYRR